MASTSHKKKYIQDLLARAPLSDERTVVTMELKFSFVPLMVTLFLISLAIVTLLAALSILLLRVLTSPILSTS